MSHVSSPYVIPGLHYREILDPVVLKPEKKTTAANDVYEGHFHHGHKMQEGTYVYSFKTPRYTYKKVLLSQNK